MDSEKKKYAERVEKALKAMNDREHDLVLAFIEGVNFSTTGKHHEHEKQKMDPLGS